MKREMLGTVAAMEMAATAFSRPDSPPARHVRSMPVEQTVITVLLLLFNLPLLRGVFSDAFVFAWPGLYEGEWWRVLTYPFVHVSWYHLLLDGAAFLLLYGMLGGSSRCERIAAVVTCAGLSLLTAMWLDASGLSHGLCGLSGPAHGLAAMVALDLMRGGNEGRLRAAGLIAFLGVTVKSLVELVTGHVLFATIHAGDVGLPVVTCHLGGVIGGIVAWTVIRVIQQTR